MAVLLLSLLLSRVGRCATECGPARSPAARLEAGSCEMAMKAADCESAARTDSALRDHYRDCARERTHLTSDTLLGCMNGLGEAAVLPIKALIGGAASFYGHFATDSKLRTEAVRTCHASTECREKVSRQSRQSISQAQTSAEFEKQWLIAQRVDAIENVALQRQSILVQREIALQGHRPGSPGYEAALDRAPPEVSAHLRRLATESFPETPPLTELVMAKARQLYTHTQCLDQRAVSELICYSALLLAAPTEAAVYLAGAKLLAKLLPRAGAKAIAAEVRAVESSAVKPVAKAAPEATKPSSPAPPTPATPAAELAREVVIHPPNTRPLGDLRAAELERIQRQVDANNIEIYVVGSAAKGKRRNVDSDLPLASFGGSKAKTKSDIDYVVKDGADDFASSLPLPDMDASFGVRGVDSINLKNSPAIHFRPHQPPVLIEGTGRLELK